MIILPKHPQSYGDIFSTALQITNKTFLKTLLFMILLFISGYAFQAVSDKVTYFSNQKEIMPALTGTLLMIVLFFVSYGLIGGVIYRIHCLMMHKDRGFISSFLYGCKKVIPLFVVSFLYALMVAIGIVLLIIPGIMVLVYCIFSMYLLYQDFGIITSLKESYHLVKGWWWRTAINVTLASLFISIIMLLGAGLVYFLGGFSQLLQGPFNLETSFLPVIGSVVMVLLVVYLYNFSISFMLNCIYDLRLRKAIV